MKRIIYSILLIIFIILAGWFILYLWAGRSIQVVKPVEGLAVQAAYATGTVEATVMMPIATHIAARLVKLNVDEGSRVVKGDFLAQLEDDHLRHTLKELQARAALAQKKHERNERLSRPGVLSHDEFDRSLAEWQAAKAAVETAEAQLSYLRLIAPENGRIIRRDGEVGELIPANQPIFWMARNSALRITAEVDEEDIPDVRVGQKVLIRADAFPDQIFHGQVQQITPKGDPVARSYRVRIGLKGDTPLKIGMTVENNIILRKDKNALLLPSSAVINEKIWRVKNGRLEQQPVEIGAKGPEQIEILKGVEKNDLVVLKPDTSLEKGQRVRPRLVKQDKQ